MNDDSPTPPKPEWDRILSAAQKNNAELINSLITGVDKISPSHANAVGQSALHIACLWGHVSAVQMLLHHKADIQAQNRIMGASPLHSCVNSSKEPFKNRVTCAKLLVDHGADVHLKDLYGMTPSDYLEKRRDTSSAEADAEADAMILAMGEVRQSSDSQVLLNLIPFLETNDLQGLVDVLLLEQDGRDRNDNHDVDVDADADAEADTHNGHHHVDVEERDPKTGKTALILATEQITKHETSFSEQQELQQQQLRTETLASIITLLLQKGADANAIPNKNIDYDVLEETLAPMYMVCKALDAEYLHVYAISQNNECQSDESKAVSISFQQNSLELIAKDLLAHGAELSPCIIQIMHDAARRGNTITLNFWMDFLKADPNTRGRQGMTPLHFAARSGKVHVVELLLSFDGIDLTVVDDRGKTSLDAAVANGRQEVVDLLKAL